MSLSKSGSHIKWNKMMGYNAENVNTKVWCIACFLENVQTEKRKGSNWRVSAGPPRIFCTSQTSSCSVNGITLCYCPSGSSVCGWPEIHPTCETKQKQQNHVRQTCRGFCQIDVLWGLGSCGQFWITGSNIDSLIWVLSDSDFWTPKKSDLVQRGPLL